MSSIIWAVKLFILSGRLRVRMAIPSSISSLMVWKSGMVRAAAAVMGVCLSEAVLPTVRRRR